jgi:hypothetical protein
MKQTTPAQKGLLTGALMIAASLFSLYVLKNPVESYFQYIIYSIFCFGIVFSMVVYYRTATDKKSFTNFFSTGFKTFVVVSLLMAAFAFILVLILNSGINKLQKTAGCLYYKEIIYHRKLRTRKRCKRKYFLQ